MGQLEIAFSRHARQQLAERGISEILVERCVREPDRVTSQTPVRFRAVSRLRRSGKPRLLIVVYDEKISGTEIVTAFYTSKIKKYL